MGIKVRFRSPPRVLPTKKTRSRWWRSIPLSRILLIGILLILAGYFFLPPFRPITVVGFVSGPLQPVTTLSQLRIVRPIARCDSTVAKGQTLVAVSNVLLANQYKVATAKAVLVLAQAQAAKQYGIRAGIAALNGARQHNTELTLAKRRKVAIYQGYKHLYTAGAIGAVTLQDAKFAAQQATAAAAAARAVVTQAKDTLAQATENANAAIRSAEATYQAQRSLLKESAIHTIHAAYAGELLDCRDNSGVVIPSGGTIYHIFERKKAYVNAFVPSRELGALNLNGTVRMRIVDVPGTVKGHVVTVVPAAKALPPDLERYFWQKPQWTQYRLVRIAFRDLSTNQKIALSYGIRANVYLPVHSWFSSVVELLP